jgi:acetoin utilization protein AcuC
MNRGLFFYTDAFQAYDMGPHHPMKPIRLRKTFELLDSYGAFGRLPLREPAPCPVSVLEKTHRHDFIQAVDYLSSGQHFPYSYQRYGFGTGDNPVFPGLFEAALLYTGASLDCASAVAEGEADVAMNIAGGLHHAHHARAAGFCVFNDCAVALRRLRERWDRVAYIDIDVHHGDGVQELFYDDPAVLTLSIHETGRTLFPGTGFVTEAGEGDGRGYSVNIPVWPGTNDLLWLDAWREIAMPILRAYKPGAVVLQLGADAHALDPLAHLCLTAQGWLEAVQDVQSLGVPIVAVGGGGYNMTTVPRMWALAASTLCGLDLPDDTPPDYAWHEEMPRLTDEASFTLSDAEMSDAKRYNDRVVAEAKETLFPYHGL